MNKEYSTLKITCRKCGCSISQEQSQNYENLCMQCAKNLLLNNNLNRRIEQPSYNNSSKCFSCGMNSSFRCNGCGRTICQSHSVIKKLFKSSKGHLYCLKCGSDVQAFRCCKATIYLVIFLVICL